MFKIQEISLWNGSEHKDYFFNENVYIYGKNSVGKTALAKVIDHVLGDHRKLDYAGLDHLTEVGAKITNDKTKLWVKRSLQANTGFFYKRTQDSDYSEISGDTYRDIIQNIIHEKIDGHRLNVYRKVFGEDPSFRSFAFVNFIDEINQGNLFSVFTRGRDARNMFRIPSIMQFFFNYKNIEDLYEKTVRLEQVESEIEDAKTRTERFVHYTDVIRNNFSTLHLEFRDDYQQNYETFLKFKKNFKREKLNSTKDLTYLTKASFQLSEEIKKYRFMSGQAEKAILRKKRDSQLLAGLNVILKRNQEFEKYVTHIVNTITELDNEGVILTLSDYDASIADIEKQKARLDRQIEIIKSEAVDLDYDKTMEYIVLLEDAFRRIDKDIDVNKQVMLEEKKKKLKKEIKELREKTNDKDLSEFNQNLTAAYLDNDLVKVKYIQEDIDRNGFKLEFVPIKQQITVWHKEAYPDKNGEEKVLLVSFDPGSLARHTHIQMLLYLLLHKFLSDKFGEMPILPLLVIDSADQTIQSEYFEIIYPKLVEYAKKIGIQLIFMSKELPDSVDRKDLIDLSDGLNPYHVRK